MQGKKQYQEKLFTSFQLSDRIPEDNFYRRLNEALDFSFLYKLTEPYYGKCGQKSVDPVVFFKLMLVGYLENIISDRKLIEHSQLRLDILYFIGYDIDEELPWHSTISRTRQKLPKEVFQAAFDRVFQMCVEKGMVAGTAQSVDSTLIKANASMETVQPIMKLENHLNEVLKQDRESTIHALTDNEQKDIPPRKSIRRSNKTHRSTTDPDARMAKKKGKPLALNYACQMSVDTAHCVISHIQGAAADKRDSLYLMEVVRRAKSRLKNTGMFLQNILADANYASGRNFFQLEQQGIEAFIPPHGQYKGGPDGYNYDRENDQWFCQQGKALTLRRVMTSRDNTKKKQYRRSRTACKACPSLEACMGKGSEKRIEISYYKPEYDRMIQRVNSTRGRILMRKRQSTVEPVFGSLINYFGLKKVNTKGMDMAHKAMVMAGCAYNLKKYMHFSRKSLLSKALTLQYNIKRLMQPITDWLKAIQTQPVIIPCITNRV